jgi:hypothetical protein
MGYIRPCKLRFFGYIFIVLFDKELWVILKVWKDGSGYMDISCHDSKFAEDTSLVISVYKMYTNCGSIEDSLNVLRSICDRSVFIFLVIDPCLKHGVVLFVIGLFDLMYLEGIKPGMHQFLDYYRRSRLQTRGWIYNLLVCLLQLL